MKKILILLLILLSISDMFSKETYIIKDYSYMNSKYENYIFRLKWSIPIKIDSSYTVDIDDINKQIIVHCDNDDVFNYDVLVKDSVYEKYKTKASDDVGNIIDIIIYKYSKDEARMELYYSFDTMMNQSGFIVKYNLRRKNGTNCKN